MILPIRWQKLAAEGAAEGTVVIAEEQKAGKDGLEEDGSLRKGQNLALDYSKACNKTFRCSKNHADCGSSGQRRSKYGISIQIKWPNDVLMDKRYAASLRK